MYKITVLPDAEDTFKKLDKHEETWGRILNIKPGWIMYETQHSLNATNGYRWISPCPTPPYQIGRKTMQYRRSKTRG